MKKLLPMVAPGLMSIPVTVWAYSLMIRGMSGMPAAYSSWATRWMAMALNPGYARMISSIERVAGSPSSAAWQSSFSISRNSGSFANRALAIWLASSRQRLRHCCEWAQPCRPQGAHAPGAAGAISSR